MRVILCDISSETCKCATLLRLVSAHLKSKWDLIILCGISSETCKCASLLRLVSAHLKSKWDLFYVVFLVRLVSVHLYWYLQVRT